MSLITESVLRSRFRQGVPQNIDVYKGDIITPSAKQYLREKVLKYNGKVKQSKKLLRRERKMNHIKRIHIKGLKLLKKIFNQNLFRLMMVECMRKNQNI